ncbi:MAG: exodeoxyribonuclease VII large subunit [Bacilli bacterium]|nr:exodeoxyribonuclease VII large subunit [Bacilli bacterium]
MENKYLEVTALTRYLKHKFDSDPNLKNVYLKGEISNLKFHTTGHLYFSIKDDNSKINAIMFMTNAKKLLFRPTDGMKVLVTGRISVYEQTGSYQIYIDEMLEDGVGNLYIAFEQLKEKLNKEGLFNKEHKRPIPKIPKRVGVITASTGAAIKDIISTIKRRFPLCETYLFPSLVQGDGAKDDIVKKIALANTFDLDVLIVGRGGGSIEDLWPFNEEIVARAIYNSKIPVVSAVGHEIDFTIADYVADLRAPTPTGAAEMVVPNINDVINHVDQLKIRLNESINKKINYLKLYLDSIKNSFVIKNPLIMYDNKKQKLDLLVEKINKAILLKVENKRKYFDNLKNSYIFKNPDSLYKEDKTILKNILEKLELLNPLSILKRGYTLTYINETIITDIKKININDQIKTKFNNGYIVSQVIGKEENNER